MRNTDLYRVKQGLDKCSALVNVADINFAYTLAKIESEIIPELRVLEKARKPHSKEYEDFLKEREQLDLDYAAQNADGSYQLLNDKLLIRDPKKYSTEITALENKYKDAIALNKKNSEEFEAFLLQESKITVTKLPKACMPAQLSVEQVKLLFPVIE
jgi:hypothetical protein